MRQRSKPPANAAPSPAPDPAVRRLLQSGTAVAMLLFLAAGLYLWLRPERPTVTTRRTAPVVSTPKYFTDVYAYVRSVASDQAVVETTITDQDGSRHSRRYTVTISETTSLSQTSQNVNTPLEAISLTDLTVGDLVQVFSTENLATVETFAATRLIKIISFTSS